MGGALYKETSYNNRSVSVPPPGAAACGLTEDFNSLLKFKLISSCIRVYCGLLPNKKEDKELPTSEAGLAVAAAVYAGRYSIQAWQTFKGRPRMRKFYEGGFQPKMTREAALILGVRKHIGE